MRTNTAHFLFLFLISFLVTGCGEDQSTIGFSSGSDRLNTILLDTVTVHTSTVWLDSLVTSGKSRLLVGGYSDPTFGAITAASYFQMAPDQVVWDLPDLAVFDSALLILKPDGYYDGDTLAAVQVEVRELKSNLAGRLFYNDVLKDMPFSIFYGSATLYNTSITPAYPEVLGSATFQPSPGKKDTLSIRLTDTLGRYWFDLMRDNDERVTSASLFQDFFKGIVITSHTNGAVTGFNASPRIRIYYHSPYGEYIQNNTLTVSLQGTNFQYNNIGANHAGTPLASLPKRDALRSAATGAKTFIQGGVGVVTRLDFPDLSALKEFEANMTIISANLTVYALSEHPQTERLPEKLELYESNSLGIPTRSLPSDANSTLPNTASLDADLEFNKYRRYTFSIYNYASSLLRKDGVYPGTLILALSGDDMMKTTDRVTIGGDAHPDFRVKLEIYYTTFSNIK